MTDRSAEAFTVVAAVEPLLAVFGSPVSEVTLAVLLSEPTDWGVTLMRDGRAAGVREVPERARDGAARDASSCPATGVAELNVTPAGSVSVSVTRVAVDGPGVADADRCR